MLSISVVVRFIDMWQPFLHVSKFSVSLSGLSLITTLHWGKVEAEYCFVIENTIYKAAFEMCWLTRTWNEKDKDGQMRDKNINRNWQNETEG